MQLRDNALDNRDAWVHKMFLLEAVGSPQSVGAPLLTPHGADGGGVREIPRANLLQDGHKDVRVAQDVVSGGGVTGVIVVIAVEH